MEILQKLLSLLERELHPHDYQLWIAPLKFESNKNEIYIIAPNSFHAEKIRSAYGSLLSKLILKITNNPSYKILINTNSNNNKNNVPKASYIEVKPQTILKQTPIKNRFKYSFDNFIVGECNLLAYSAAKEVANKIFTSFNPLFIYGGIGIGKTHLLQAIANEINNNNEVKINYTTGENFTVEFIQNIQTGSLAKFQNRNRNYDTFIIDEVQFLSEKTKTQEEFYNTCKHLLNENKQLVISANSSPGKLNGFDDRLISLFESGLVVELNIPDYKTRVEIIQSKAKQQKVELKSEVIEFIAENVDSHIRQIEGIVVRLLAESSLTGKEINIQMAQNCLKSYGSAGSKEININSIEKMVCKYFNINEDNLKTKKRKKEVALPRQVAMYLSRKWLRLPYPHIGKFFGGKDHATVIHACRKIEETLPTNEYLKDMIEKIEYELDNEKKKVG